MNHLGDPLHAEFDVRCYAMSQASLMRWGYRPFTSPTVVIHPLP